MEKNVPAPVNTVIQNVWMTQKTKPYQVLLKANQMSDFIFRYAQIYGGTRSFKEEMRDAIDNYINYPIPLNRLSQILDKSGPAFFITYFTRIQQVIKKMAKTHPSRFFGDILSQFLFDYDSSGIEDASIFNRGLSPYDPRKVINNLWEVVSPSGVEWVAETI